MLYIQTHSSQQKYQQTKVNESVGVCLLKSNQVDAHYGNDMDIGHTVETVITHQLANEKSHHYKILAILKIYQILVKT